MAKITIDPKDAWQHILPADIGRIMLTTYGGLTQADGLYLAGGEALSFLLADLMHYAEANGIDFPDALESAQEHFEAEQDESEDDYCQSPD